MAGGHVQVNAFARIQFWRGTETAVRTIWHRFMPSRRPSISIGTVFHLHIVQTLTMRDGRFRWPRRQAGVLKAFHIAGQRWSDRGIPKSIPVGRRRSCRRKTCGTVRRGSRHHG